MASVGYTGDIADGLMTSAFFTLQRMNQCTHTTPDHTTHTTIQTKNPSQHKNQTELSNQPRRTGGGWGGQKGPDPQLREPGGLHGGEEEEDEEEACVV